MKDPYIACTILNEGAIIHQFIRIDDFVKSYGLPENAYYLCHHLNLRMFHIHLFTLIGLAAAACTTISFVPQAIRVIKTQRTRDISLGMYILFSLGTFLWLTYGICTWDLPIIAANAITFSLSLAILIMKLRYK